MARKVKPVADMTDENFMKHLERSHPEDLKIKFTVEPDRTERRMLARPEWEAFHNTLHRIYPNGQTDEHQHG